MGDFTAPTRNVQLPALPNNVDKAIGAGGKPVVIKKNIFERNRQRHSDLTPNDSKDILKSALYEPSLYGQNQLKQRPYNWVVIKVKWENGNHKLVLLEIDRNKDNVEIVHWHYLDDKGLEKIKRQALDEDGQLLILPPESSEEVGALSDPIQDLSTGKGTNAKQEKQEAGAKNADGVRHRQGGDFAPMSKEQGEALLHELGKTGLAGASIESHEDFIKGLEQRQGARFSEETESANEHFNEQLTAFEKGELPTEVSINFGSPSDVLCAAGVPNKPIKITQATLRKHLKKHGLTTNDIRDLVKAMAKPLMVYTWGEKAKNHIIITNITTQDGRKITTAIRFENKGLISEINEMASVHGKALERLAHEMNTDKTDFGKDNLKYVDKEKVLDWLSMETPLVSRQAKQELFSATKIVENFENPKIEADKNRYQERFMRKGDGTIYGYFDEQGVAHFDESVMNGNTAMHEFGHPWQDWCKRTNPKLYERGVELINESPYIDEVRKEAQDPDSVYYGMSEEQMADEAIARAIGDKGEKMLEKHGVFKFAQLRD